MRIRLAALCLTLALSASGLAQPQQPVSEPVASTVTIPRLIRFSGQLKVTSGTVGITFTLHKTQQDEAALWTETQNVKVDESGKYTVLLGATKPDGIPTDLFTSGDAQWLAIHVQGQPDQRVLLVSVPYAMKAAEAETLAGHASTDFVTSEQLTSAVQQQLQQQSTPSTRAAAASGVVANNTPAMANATDFSDTTGNQVVSVTQNGTGNALTATSSNTALIASSTVTSGTASGVQGHTYSTSGVGVYGFAHATTGNTIGVEGNTTSPSGVGVYGYNGSTTGFSYGVLGQTQSTDGTGLRGYSTATTGATKGVLAAVSSPSGTAAIFQNNGGGKLISGQSGTSHTEVFSVSGSGDVVANSSVTSPSLVSTAPNGVQPLTVTSQTLVQNLNVGLLGGVPATDIPTLIYTNVFTGMQNFNNSASVLGTLSVTGGATGQAVWITGGSGADALQVSGGAGYAAAFLTGGASTTGAPGLQSTGGAGSTGTGAPGGSFTGGQSASNYGGDGIDANGASSNGSGNPGNGVSGGGGAANGTVFVGGDGLIGNGGVSTVANGRGGSGAYVRGGDATGTSGILSGGYGIYAQGGNAASGTGGTGLYAVGGTGVNPGYAAQFGGPVTVYGNSVNALFADPGCGANWLGIGFFTGVPAFTGCTNYNIAGDGTDMLLNVVTGGAIRFRQANVDSMYINSAGNVIINGNLAVNGAISAGTKDFVIDHPLDPQNKLLYHTSIESPDMKTLYDGVVKLNAKGEAWVSLPDYFEALNGDFRYMLTAIGSAQPRLHVAQEVKGNRFKIAGGHPNGKVSWQVTGIRHDAFANANRGPVEVEKTIAEKGKYLHPEAFGLSPGLPMHGAPAPTGTVATPAGNR